jgi:hypothetical protein
MNSIFQDLDVARTRLSRILGVPEGFRDKRSRRQDTKDSKRTSNPC